VVRIEAASARFLSTAPISAGTQRAYASDLREFGRWYGDGEIERVDVRVLADWVAERHGVRLSADRVRRHLRRAHISWQRTSRSLRHKQDPAEVAERGAVLTDRAKKGMQA